MPLHIAYIWSIAYISFFWWYSRVILVCASKLKCKTIFLCNTYHTLCLSVCSAKGKWGRLPDFCENYRVFRSSWRKLLRFNVIGKKHILNLPVISLLMGTLAPFSKHTQSFLSQFGIRIISLNAFNFRIIFSFDWHKVYHSRGENINTYLNKELNNTEFYNHLPRRGGEWL